MEKLTIGQVLDTLKLGEVAVKVETPLANEVIDSKYAVTESGIAIHYDESRNNTLRWYHSGELVSFAHAGVVEHFVIMNKELYTIIKRW